jgi:hypothetical protein
LRDCSAPRVARAWARVGRVRGPSGGVEARRPGLGWGELGWGELGWGELGGDELGGDELGGDELGLGRRVAAAIATTPNRPRGKPGD